MSIDLNLFTFLAFAIPLGYWMTHAGASEHAGWVISGKTIVVVLVSILLFCIGIDAFGLFHFLFGWR